jgi:hypothetical protein
MFVCFERRFVLGLGLSFEYQFNQGWLFVKSCKMNVNLDDDDILNFNNYIFLLPDVSGY